MGNPLFVEVKRIVSQWIQDNSESFKRKNITIETIENTENCLYIIMNCRECMAAIIVTEPDFAPYRFISFEAVALVNDAPKMVYSWYDDKDTTTDEITVNLDKAIDIVLEYNNRI